MKHQREATIIRWYDEDDVSHYVWGDGRTLYADARCRQRWTHETIECVGRDVPPTEPITCIRCVADFRGYAP